MENEKIVEEKNVEKKPKKKMDGVTIFLIIIALAAIIGIAYLYFYTDILTPYENQRKDMTGSSYIGEYVLDTDPDPEKSGFADVIDGKEVPQNQTLYLKADGTCYVIDHNDNDFNMGTRLWEETEDGFRIHDSGYAADNGYACVLQADGRFALCFDHNIDEGECQCSIQDCGQYWRKVN